MLWFAFVRSFTSTSILCLSFALGAFTTFAQDRRVVDPITFDTVALRGVHHPKALPENDAGAMDPSWLISGINIIFKSSAAQSAALEALLAEQQDPTSPKYHSWLPPEEYADRFGLCPADLATIGSWLTSQGFRLDYTARGRNWLTFSGTVAQVRRAFGTEIHSYKVDGEMHFANTTDPLIPAALAPVVLTIQGLNDFRMRSQRTRMHPVPEFTISGDPNHYLFPGDLATTYNINPLYQGNINGTGQKIAVAGQTNIYLSDIQAFRSLVGLPNNDPQVLLVPGRPDPGFDPSELVEADLDVEYAGAVASNATIVYVYSDNVIASVAYAIDQALAPVISLSYGLCESQISGDPANTGAAFRSAAQEANALGITWVSASGDQGAGACDTGNSGQLATGGLAVVFPASVPEVTAVGGTEFNEGDGRYWSARNNSNLSSAVSYIPEIVWNDTSVDMANGGGFAATGGGSSILFSKPNWQVGPGVPNDNARDVPDISFAASGDHDGYIIYSAGQALVVGGTSASTPVFAGILALLNHYLVSSGIQPWPGLGNVNPTLYLLAQSNPAVFHDITSGNNFVPCADNSQDCVNGQLGFSAGPGYDLAVGLGSADINSLITQWYQVAATSFAANSSLRPSAAVLVPARPR